MDKAIEKAILNVVDICHNDKHIHKAMSYLSECLVVRASNTLFKNCMDTKHMSLTIGKPNYAQKQFIKMLKKGLKCDEPFPSGLIQLKLKPKRRK